MNTLCSFTEVFIITSKHLNKLDTNSPIKTYITKSYSEIKTLYWLTKVYNMATGKSLN